MGDRHDIVSSRVALRKNAPSFIYEILHGEPRFLTGKTDTHGQQMWLELPVKIRIVLAVVETLTAMSPRPCPQLPQGSFGNNPDSLLQ